MLEKKLQTILETVQGNGAFATTWHEALTMPGLQINGVEEIGLPLSEVQAKEIIKVARQAPFGKGRATITDTSVRNSWEIDADQVSFKNPAWQKALNKMVRRAEKDLGFPKKAIDAHLYKVLLYETGSFFLPHKDSEKEKGMFGTLSISLPARHTGGHLSIRFAEEELQLSTETLAAQYQIGCAAFFADCEHEIQPITSGYRLTLIYNLILVQPKLALPQLDRRPQVQAISEVLDAMKAETTQWPKVILLGHEYTEANLSLEGLKGADRPRAEVLLKAAEKSGYFASLGLFTKYQMGELEGSSYNWSDSDESDLYMGEVYEEEETLNLLKYGNLPELGSMEMPSDRLIKSIEIGTGKPTDTDYEGYTGNAGMTMEYWYHYGVIVLWPFERHAHILSERDLPIQLQWIDYYAAQVKQGDKNARSLLPFLIEEVAQGIATIPRKYDYDILNQDFSMLIEGLIVTEDPLLVKKVQSSFHPVFALIDSKHWLSLAQSFGVEVLTPLLHSIAQSEYQEDLCTYLSFLDAYIQQTDTLDAFAKEALKGVPAIVKRVHWWDLTGRFYRLSNREKMEELRTILIHLFSLSKSFTDPNWTTEILGTLTENMHRDYVNQILIYGLLNTSDSTLPLLRSLWPIVSNNLRERVGRKPNPPSDLIRSMPERQNEFLQLLDNFMASPSQVSFDYVAKEQLRKAMQRSIRSAGLDVKTETIKKGSPYTLRITKTEKAYKRAMKAWKEDVELFERVEMRGG